MDVRQLSDRADYARWDAFIRGCPAGTFFHLSGWRDVIAGSFGHPTIYLFAERKGEITGVLPMAHVRSRLFGRKLISLPFCAYGGIATEDEASRAALAERATQTARQLQVDFLELRNLNPQDDLATSDRYVTFRKALEADPERVMNSIPRKQRAMIRKGTAMGLVPRQDSAVSEFYSVYAESLRNLGTPVLPLRYFKILKKVFGDDCEVMTVATSRDPSPVAAVMSFYFRDEVLPYYGGGTQQARVCHAYDFMYWELLVHAMSRGVHHFDFGRSRKGTGSYRFKIHWGFEPAPLHYQYQLVRAQTLPNVTPDNPKYHAFIRLWQKLPVPVATLIGPWLARNLG